MKHVQWAIPLAGAVVGGAMAVGAARSQLSDVVERTKVLEIFKADVGQQLAVIETKQDDEIQRLKRLEEKLDQP